MITLLIWLLVFVLVFGVVVYVVQTLPLPAPYRSIALAILGLIFILIIVSMLLGDLPLRPINVR
jgi:hypothetical protein